MLIRRCLSVGRRKLFKFASQDRSLSLTAESNSDSPLTLSYASYQQTISVVDGPPVLVFHGLLGSKTNWHSLAKALSRSTGRKVFAVDARNHGESPHSWDMDFSVMTSDILHLMDELHIEKAALLGHSVGGKTCMTTALTHPDRVASLVVVDVSPAVSPNINTYPAVLEAMMKVELQVYDNDPSITLSAARIDADKKLQEVEKSEDVRQFLLTNLVENMEGRIRWRVNLDAIINNFGTLASFPEFLTEKYNGPTLFVGGANSVYMREKELPEIERLFPNARVKYIEGAGHWVHAEKPSEILSITKQFLKESAS